MTRCSMLVLLAIAPLMSGVLAPSGYATLRAGQASAELDRASPAVLLQRAIHLMETKGDCAAAIPLFETAATGADRGLAARALLHVGRCHELLGRSEARSAYERVVRDFAAEEAAAEARVRLTRLRTPPPATSAATLAIRRLPLASDDGIGAVSADGRYLLRREQDGGLARVTLASGAVAPVALRSPDGTDTGPFAYVALSADGTRLAYTRAPPDGQMELRVGTLPAGHTRQIAVDPAVELPRPLAWSPDGTWLVGLFTMRGYRHHLVVVRPATGTVHVIKDLGALQPLFASISPDGRWILYDLPAEDAAGRRDLLVADSSNGRQEHIVQHPANDLFGQWAPDGRHVLFASDRTGTLSAWLQRVHEGSPVDDPVLVKRDLGRIWPRSMTTDGKFYFDVQAGTTDLYLGEIDPATGRISEPSLPVRPQFAGSSFMPDWSADGRHLVYIEQPGSLQVGPGARALVVRDVDSGDERRLFPPLMFFIGPRWSPDKRAMLVRGRNTEGRWGLHRLDLATGVVSAAVLAERPGEESFIGPNQWAPDGRGIVYVRRDVGIILRDLPTGSERVVVALDPDEQVTPGRGFDYSPDAQRLAFGVRIGQGPTSVHALRVQEPTGAVRELLRLPPPEWLLMMGWSPDGNHLLFTRMRPAPDGSGDTQELWRVPVGGGAPEPTGLARTGLRGIALHPDGRRVAFVAGEERWETWVMENFLPPGGRSASTPGERDKR